jgi:hypothetical protein
VAANCENPNILGIRTTSRMKRPQAVKKKPAGETRWFSLAISNLVEQKLFLFGGIRKPPVVLIQESTDNEIQKGVALYSQSSE